MQSSVKKQKLTSHGLSNKNLVKVLADNLIVGMYVQSLDRPWNETTFLFQGFLVENERILLALKKQCNFAIVSISHCTQEVAIKLEHPVAAVAKRASTIIVSHVSIEKASIKKKPKPTTTYSLTPEQLSSWLNIAGRYLHTLFNTSNRQVKIKPNYSLSSIQSSDIINALEAKRMRAATRIRNRFSKDPLVSSEVVDYKIDTSIKSESQLALSSQVKLASSMSAVLAHDMHHSNINESLSVTKEALSDVVSSVTRNPDAMRLVSNIKDFDDYSYQHALDVSLMMIAFGREVGLPRNDLIEIGLGGLLHDVGEIKPPNGSRSPRVKNIMQFKIYKEHVEVGVKMILNDGHSGIVQQILANHHERYDGSGYPNKLKSHNIGFYGHMIAIVDTYISMTSGRRSDISSTPSQALGYIISEQGKSLHPSLVHQFVQLVGVYPVGSIVRLNSGDVGVVVKQNRLRRLRPVVMLVADKNSEPLKSQVTVDLLTYSGPSDITILHELPANFSGIRAENYLI